MNNKSRIKIPDKEDNGEVNIEWFINEQYINTFKLLGICQTELQTEILTTVTIITLFVCYAR